MTIFTAEGENNRKIEFAISSHEGRFENTHEGKFEKQKQYKAQPTSCWSPTVKQEKGWYSACSWTLNLLMETS